MNTTYLQWIVFTSVFFVTCYVIDLNSSSGDNKTTVVLKVVPQWKATERDFAQNKTICESLR